MNLVVLTTDTFHHCHFVREVARVHAPTLVMAERGGPEPPFEVRHDFEQERDAYERDRWFAGASPVLADLAPTVSVDSINDPASIERLRAARPDAIVVFGTRWLHEPVIDVCREGIVNLHGGDPEAYRGLDSHLWAIYHGDFQSLVTSLHRVNADLDDGPVVERRQLPIDQGLGLHELRSRNTETCVEIVRSALDGFMTRGRFQARPQRERGRYYSFMPAVLKETCRDRFERYTGAKP